MASSTYRLFAEAMAQRKQILCVYGGYKRELCAVVLGGSDGREVAVTFQFAGESTRRLPAGGQWRCLFLSGVSEVRLREGAWYAGSSHDRPQSCVKEVDLDVNPDGLYRPRRRLSAPRTAPRKQNRLR